MARIPPIVLRRYLLGGHLTPRGCLRMRIQPSARPPYTSSPAVSRMLHTESEAATEPPPVIPFRKQLKDEKKQRKAEGLDRKKSKLDNQTLEDWELTVGIEIHAQLNTAKKLFSRASTDFTPKPNSNVAWFDLAMPGSMPIFQKATLIPAIRAALALNCDIQKVSRFDRKHYFHWDQPSGYQITQFYEPFAKDGYITLYAHDGIAKEDGEQIKIGIKQVQMEQDTAKTISQPGGRHLLDFNRVGVPLIEIITLPHIHHPSTAAALVRKVQTLLNAVDSCVLGLEAGGLRADVNVSVRKRDADSSNNNNSYAGVTGLGQRTEIKNLSSFKAIEDAIIAERDRQIQVIEAGGEVAGETRGWTIGSSETRRLRGKEGEVDYRYMPDPDLSPVIISPELVEHLRSTMGVLPDAEIDVLTETYGLTIKDAMSLVALDGGARAEYFRNVVNILAKTGDGSDMSSIGKTCCNWVLHELGGLVSDSGATASDLKFTMDGTSLLSPKNLADLIRFSESKQITGKTAKKLLVTLFENALAGTPQEVQEVSHIIDEGDLWFRPMSTEEYDSLAQSILDMTVVEQILKGQKGKIMFLVGQMMRNGEEGRVDPIEAKKVVERIVEAHRK